MTRMLDRQRYYATIYGDPERRFMQDGLHFDASGKALNEGNATGSKPVTADVGEPAQAVELKDERSTLLAELNRKAVPVLKKLAEKVNAATGATLPKGGTGAKARLVKYIADNSE